MSELMRTCWRCGSDQVQMVGAPDGPCVMIHCKNCEVMVGVLGHAFGSPSALRQAWNERAADEGFEELVAENEELKAQVLRLTE